MKVDLRRDVFRLLLTRPKRISTTRPKLLAQISKRYYRLCLFAGWGPWGIIVVHYDPYREGYEEAEDG